MPKLLVDRCSRYDSVYEFRRASRIRYDDALSLATQGRYTTAIYLWGYVIEMQIKAAYFEAIASKKLHDPIEIGRDIRPAIRQANQSGLMFRRFNNAHDFLAWAEWLILARINQNSPHASSFARKIQLYAQRAYPIWRETLRYHKNRAYLFEAKRMNTSAEWFLSNSRFL